MRRSPEYQSSELLAGSPTLRARTSARVKNAAAKRPTIQTDHAKPCSILILRSVEPLTATADAPPAGGAAVAPAATQ